MSELTFNSIKSEPQKLQDHSTLIAFQSSIYQIIAHSKNYNIRTDLEYKIMFTNLHDLKPKKKIIKYKQTQPKTKQSNIS